MSSRHAIQAGRPEVSVEVVSVVKVTTTRGCGVTFCSAPHEHQIIRRVVQYFSLEGVFLAEHDPWPDGKDVLR